MKVREWRGGRVWQDSDGRRTFHIRRTIGGVTHEISTGCTTLAAAVAHLERFERDPEGYKASLAAAEPVMLDVKRTEAFLRWSLDPKDGKGNSAAWVTKQRAAIAWWAERIGPVDLRRVDLKQHILPALDGASDRATRIRVLKAFYGWCRKVDHSIGAAQDPTLDTLTAPPARPAQRVRSKIIPRAHYLLVRDALSDPWRSALIVQAGTGLHTTEVVRFAASGTIEPMPPAMRIENGAVGVLVVEHKSGDTHRVAVSQEVLDAAKRLKEHAARMAVERETNKAAALVAKLREAGKKVPKQPKPTPDAFSREWYDRAVRSACRSVKRPDGGMGIPVFTPGRFRHSVAHWAVEAGADPFAVSAFLGHKSPATTKKFYASLACPVKVPTLA